MLFPLPLRDLIKISPFKSKCPRCILLLRVIIQQQRAKSAQFLQGFFFPNQTAKACRSHLVKTIISDSSQFLIITISFFDFSDEMNYIFHQSFFIKCRKKGKCVKVSMTPEGIIGQRGEKKSLTFLFSLSLH